MVVLGERERKASGCWQPRYVLFLGGKRWRSLDPLHEKINHYGKSSKGVRNPYPDPTTQISNNSRIPFFIPYVSLMKNQRSLLIALLVCEKKPRFQWLAAILAVSCTMHPIDVSP